MAERMVFLRFGRKAEAIPLVMELTDDQVSLRIAVSSEEERGERALGDLHLRFFFSGTPHGVGCRTDAMSLLHVDAITMPREVAEDELFPKLIGLADAADSTPGIH